MRQTHLWREAAVEVDGETPSVSQLSHPTKSAASCGIGFPTQYNSLITPSCDPFVVATILLSMQWAAPVAVHGQVSPTLLQNLEEFQAAWSAWEPQRYHPVKISADVEQEQPRLTRPIKLSRFLRGR
jgi:hypothetical protein